MEEKKVRMIQEEKDRQIQKLLEPIINSEPEFRLEWIIGLLFAKPENLYKDTSETDQENLLKWFSVSR